MTDTSRAEADPVNEAIARALQAASLATDAGHEAEAIIAARDQAMQALRRTASRASLLSTIAAVLSVGGIAMGAVIWLRSSADLRDAATLSAETSAAFVERVVALDNLIKEMETARKDTSAQNAELATALSGTETRLAEQIAGLRETIDASGASLPEDAAAAFAPELETLRNDVMSALAEVQLGLTQSPEPTAGGNLSEVTARLDAVASRLEAVAAAPAPASTAKAPENKPTKVAKTSSRPTRKPAKTASQPDPYSFP